MAGAVDLWEQKGNVHTDMEATRPAQRHHYLAELAARHGGAGHYLDVGCGPGLLLELVKKLQPEATFSVADAYPACLDLSEQRLGTIAGRYLLGEVDFNPERVIDDSFDVIIMSHVLEHLRCPADGIEALLTLLKPGG